MKTILLESKELIEKRQEENLPTKRNWDARQTSLNESWKESRSTIFKTLLMSAIAVPDNVKCQNCLEKASEVRCKECVTQEYLCHICDCKVHEQLPFHDREAIINGPFVPIPATTARNSNGECVIVGKYLQVF